MSDCVTDIELANVDIGDAGRVPGFKAHGTPDTAGDETRSPIPTKLIGGLANVSLGLGMSTFAPGVVGSNLGCGLDRRRENHAQCIRAGLEVGLHVDAPLAKHVVGSEDELVVEIDLGVGAVSYTHLRAHETDS